ncbi:PREDICTED: uncharacterized protein LOC108363779 isoform X1 [Rhagoletis zephyria]|uniref:uncharacterized protein LOC118746757 n=1 Tax=Rhagoletis pomonella TaxID=28610 RepID=UPI0008119B8A|nr:PREDICTED: uncharacterized protein LOC108363779 isoform X1 [Rhagoletis zephyria]XP_036336560.1 uncharacterized protein LOC118746757 [Rhagoletis pomonella]
MWNVLLVCIVAVLVMNSEGARQHKRYATDYAGGSAGSYAGGSAGGYGGNAGFYDGGFNDYDYNYAPDFNFIDPLVFHQQLTAQILANHASQQHAIASVYSSGSAMATADASFLPDHNRIQQQIAQQQAHFNNLNIGGSRYDTANRYAPNHAIAAASIGPGGSYHTAHIGPENPDVPNISNRFGGPSSPGGFKGVSVSSFSSSSDINGKKMSQRGAQTTINDNGKITTYRVQS